MDDILKYQSLFQEISLIASNNKCELHGIDMEKKWIDVNCPEETKHAFAVEAADKLQNFFK